MELPSRIRAHIPIGQKTNNSRNSSAANSQQRSLTTTQYMVSSKSPANHPNRFGTTVSFGCRPAESDNPKPRKNPFFLSKDPKAPTLQKSNTPHNVNKPIPQPIPDHLAVTMKIDSSQNLPNFSTQIKNITDREILLKRVKKLSRLVKENYIDLDNPKIEAINKSRIDSLSYYRGHYIKSLFTLCSENERTKKIFILNRSKRPASAHQPHARSFLDQSMLITSECNSFLNDKSLLEFTKRKKQKVSSLYNRIFSRFAQV